MKEQKAVKKAWRSKTSTPFTGAKHSPVSSSLDSNSQQIIRYIYNDGCAYDWHIAVKKIITAFMAANCYEALILLPVGMDNPSIPAYDLDSDNREQRDRQYNQKLDEWNRYNDFNVHLMKKIVSESNKTKGELDAAMYHISYGIRTQIRSSIADLEVTNDRTMDLDDVWNITRIDPDAATAPVAPTSAPMSALQGSRAAAASRFESPTGMFPFAASAPSATPLVPTPIQRQSTSSSSYRQSPYSMRDYDSDEELTMPLRTPGINITSMTPNELRGLAPMALVTVSDADRDAAIKSIYKALNRACIKLISYHDQRVTLGDKPSKWYKDFKEASLPPMPVLDIRSELEVYDMKVAIKWAKSITRLFMSSGLTDEIIKTKMESIITTRYDDDDWKRDKFIDERESTHNKELSTWYQQQKVFDERSASAVRVFSTVLGPSATQHITELLKRKAFREAWCKLN